MEDSTNPDSSPFVINSSGAVGIGTSPGVSKLTIVGDISQSSGNFTTAGNLSLGSYNNGNGWIASYGGGYSFGRGANNIINVTDNLYFGYSLQKFTNAIVFAPVPSGNNLSSVYNLTDGTVLYFPFKELLASSPTSSIGYGGTLQLKIMSYVFTTTVSTGVQVQTVGTYTSPVFAVNAATNSSGFTGFTLNGVTTAQNITTVEGLVQSAGGVPASGYATIQATAATTTAHGAINLTLRGHTTADSGTTTFVSFTTAEIISSLFWNTQG